MRKNFDISCYLVIGPENTKGRPVREIVRGAVSEGFTFIQIRSKTRSAREIIELLREAANEIKSLGKENEVSLVVNDRLDIAYAAREMGIKVDGIHVGQSDIPPEICRKLLGEAAIVGLSAPTEELLDYIKNIDIGTVDYFGIGPLHKTYTKPDSGLTSKGNRITRTLSEIKNVAKLSPLPIVIGGGVKNNDLRDLKETGADGFFVVSAICGAENPKAAAWEMVNIWRNNG